MDTRKHMIMTGGKIITRDVRLCSYNQKTEKYDLQFYTGKTYSYDVGDLLWMQEPRELPPELYHVSYQGRELPHVGEIYIFTEKGRSYWHICFDDGNEADYEGEALSIRDSCLNDEASYRVFSYLKQAASISGMQNQNGKNLLEKQYAELCFVGKQTVLAGYLNPKDEDMAKETAAPIFPFGCSKSGYQALKAALEHTVSLVQGDSEEARIQVILNLAANLLMKGKTMQIVVQRPVEMKRMLELLAESACPFGFLAAPLGSAADEKEFWAGQSGVYPPLSAWKQGEELIFGPEHIQEKIDKMYKILAKEEVVEALRQDLKEVEAEYQRVRKSAEEMDVDIQDIRVRKSLDSEQCMDLWKECLRMAAQEIKIGISFKLRCHFTYGISGKGFYKQDLIKVTTMMQGLFYQAKQKELQECIRQMEEVVRAEENAIFSEISDASTKCLQAALYRQYGEKEKRNVFAKENIRNTDGLDDAVLKEYPIVFTTAAYAGYALGRETVYDYLIVEEASQTDIATGALLLAQGKNAVLLGTGRQVTDTMKAEQAVQITSLFKDSGLPDGYNASRHGFLQSVKAVLPQAPYTVLEEL